MLTNRQKNILFYMGDNIGEFVSTSFFAEKYNVSMRSIQTDLQSIRKECNLLRNVFSIETNLSLGTKLTVKNTDLFDKYCEYLRFGADEKSLNYRGNRINRLLHILLNQKSPISITKCADLVYVSPSTIVNDIKNLGSLLTNYNLSLEQKRGKITIIGLERDKRLCMVDNDDSALQTIPSEIKINSDVDQVNIIRKLFVDELIRYQCQISDIEFQSLVIWINASIKRIKAGFYLDDNDLEDTRKKDGSKEYAISRQIYQTIGKKYNIIIPDNEVLFLATYLENHSFFTDAGYISPDLNQFVSSALDAIEQIFPAKLNEDINLRISLALHCAPLISRARNSMQIRNKMKNYVKQNMSYAFDIATYFVFLLSGKYNCKIIEDETAFIAVYFNKSILLHKNKKDKKNVLLITSLKRSARFLLEQLITNNYGDLIYGLTFVTPAELDGVDLEDYDAFLATEDGEWIESGLALKISIYPDDNDLKNIRSALEGYEDMGNIMELFDPRLFFVGNYQTKEEVQEQLVSRAEKLYNIDNLAEEIELRNEFGSTYFGNSVAILHPMSSVSNSSFIGEVILKTPLVWDDDNKVRFVFLVCLQKNNIASFQAWDIISPIIFNSDFKKRLSTIDDFEDFKQMCMEMLKRGK